MEKTSGRVIGFAGLKHLEDLGEVDLGYRLLPASWGLGLATEAGRAILDYGGTCLGLSQVIALVVPENVASVRVLEKLGLSFEKLFEYQGHPVAKYIIKA